MLQTTLSRGNGSLCPTGDGRGQVRQRRHALFAVETTECSTVDEASGRAKLPPNHWVDTYTHFAAQRELRPPEIRVRKTNFIPASQRCPVRIAVANTSSHEECVANSFIRRSRLLFFRMALMLLATGFCIPARAADEARIKAAIAKAQRYLQQSQSAGGYGSIGALAYVKSGGNKNASFVKKVLEEIQRKISAEAVYQPGSNHNYEAGVDLMLLEALDPEAYRPQLESILDYLLKNQQPNGSWFYDHNFEVDCGDTSITQYVIMALWAATRAGLDVPIEVWERAARWHIEKQQEDGGFAYQPFDSKITLGFEYHHTTETMTAAGSSSLLIIRRMLFDDADLAPEIRPADSKRRFGVLERFVDERPAGQKRSVKGAPTLRAAAVDKALKESIRRMGAHLGDKNPNHEKFYAYHLYTIERVAALLDVQKIGGHEWYTEGADELLQRQAPDGSWADSCQAPAATAMGLMFLSKATTTVITPRKRIATVGGGLQAGGRGLPDNLDAVQVKDGAIAARKLMGPVDNLLIELERSSEAKVEDIQAAVVEAVQLDRPEELIGQTARLQKLATDSRVEVRRTALWALGRSGDLALAKWLIPGLVDPDLSVVREASLALSVLTRRLEGCGLPVDPLDDAQMGLSDDSSEEERTKKLDDWKRESKKRWSEWYLKNRPYDERDDRTTLNQNNK